MGLRDLAISEALPRAGVLSGTAVSAETARVPGRRAGALRKDVRMTDADFAHPSFAQACLLPRRVTRFLNARSVDRWQHAFETVTVNRFQEVTLLAYFEGIRTLIERRDAVDDLREYIVTDGRGERAPTSRQQIEVHRVVSAFFDSYYSALSRLSAVVARFQDVFPRNFADNGPFIDWLVQRYELPAVMEGAMTSARLFRAILAHPQQFPAHDWGTMTDVVSGGLLRMVLWGPYGRGKTPVPKGAEDNANHRLDYGEGWHFIAPDEVHVLNVLGMVGELPLAQILSAYTARSAFTPSLSMEQALERIEAGQGDLSEDLRRVKSLYDSEFEMPSLIPKPWIRPNR